MRYSHKINQTLSEQAFISNDLFIRNRGDVKWHHGYPISKIQKMRTSARFLAINCRKEKEVEFDILKEV